MKLSLIALVLLGVTVAAEEQATEASLVGLDELVSDFEDAEDAEDASSSRRRRRRRWHRHRPHRHRPHHHWPHGHRPHHHAPHGHRPHFHSPHGHRPHFHFPHGHRPHIHHPHAHVPHGHRPHVHHPHAHVPHLHHPHHHRPGSFFSAQFWEEAGSACSDNMGEAFWVGQAGQPNVKAFFGVLKTEVWDVLAPAMVSFGEWFVAAMVEVYTFLDWLFAGGHICNIRAEDWQQTMGNTLSVGGMKELGNLDQWNHVVEDTEKLLMIACSIYWMKLELSMLWLSFAVACIGMLIKKCEVLGGSNPSIEVAYSAGAYAQGYPFAPGFPQILIGLQASVYAGVSFCITSFSEKQCYIFFSCGLGISILMPPMTSANFGTTVSAVLVINGYPTKDGWCNGWGFSGSFECFAYACGPNPAPITLKMCCTFFYRNYWFKFNSISTNVTFSTQAPNIQSPWQSSFGLTFSKIWVAICVMARVNKSCRQYYTGSEQTWEDAWNNYFNDGAIPTFNPGDQAGAFSGYGTN